MLGFRKEAFRKRIEMMSYLAPSPSTPRRRHNRKSTAFSRILTPICMELLGCEAFLGTSIVREDGLRPLERPFRRPF